MNISNPEPGDSQEDRWQIVPTEEPLDTQVVPIKRDAASTRARALQIIDEYDGLLQRLVEIVGKSS